MYTSQKVTPVADLRRAPPPPTAQTFVIFIQFLGKFWQNHRLAPPPGGLALPPIGNPGSAPVREYE